MSAFCSCFHVPDVQDNSSSPSEGCWCLNCCFQNFINKGTRSTSSENQQDASSNSEVVVNFSNDESTSDSSSQPDDDRSMLLQGLHTDVKDREETDTSRSATEPEPYLIITVTQEFVQKDETLDSNSETVTLDPESDSSVKIVSQETESGFPYSFLLPDDEDVCPTCLEEYIEENPKIVTKCSHHYHLSCIYEWMQRSPTCPVCRELMLFDESG